MPTAKPMPRRTMGGALLVGLLTLATAMPAAANDEIQNPWVGGDNLYDNGVQAPVGTDPLPKPSARSFVIADLETGAIIAAKDAHRQLRPASTLKMLTALTVLPQLDPDAVYTATADDVHVAGSRVGIVAGSTYTARQLLSGLFLVSGNDAATALARMNGSVEATVTQMQAEAGRLQAYDTVVGNPSGLDTRGQVSSAFDLALIARAGLARDDFASWVKMSNDTFPVAGDGDPRVRATRQIWNQNDLITGGFPGAIGVKSGYTSGAGRTLAAAAERDGKRYLVTMMGIAGGTYETGAQYLEWAFANGSRAEPVGNLVGQKYDAVPTDSALVVPPGERLKAAHALPSVTVLQVHPGGHVRWLIAGLIAICCLLIRLGLSAPYRRALRKRQTAPAVGPVSLSDEVLDYLRQREPQQMPARP